MKNLKLILLIMKDRKWHFIGSSILLIAGIFIRMLEPKIFEVAIDYVGPISKGIKGVKAGSGDFVVTPIVNFLGSFAEIGVAKLILILVAIYLIVSVFRATFVFVAKSMNAAATEYSIANMRQRFFTHLQSLPMDYFPTITTGELIQRSTGDIETIRRFISNQAVEVLRLLAIFLFAAFWLFKGNVLYGFISIAVVPLIGISGYLFFKREQKVWKKHEDEADKLNAIAQENISGIRVVKAFAQEEEEIEKFEIQNQRKLDVAISHAKLHAIFWPFSDFLVHFQIIVSIFVGGYMAVNQIISVGELVSFYTYIVMVAWPLRQVGRLLSDMGMALVAMDRIQNILEADEEKDEAKYYEDFGALRKIVFEDVWFRFGEKEPFVLQGINLTIKPGETVAILGPTGAGKSTLVKLLLRFYEPQKGRILINDIPIETISKKLLRKKLGLILQSAFLFTETVAGNIAYATEDVSEEMIKATATLAGLGEIESIFSEGFNTQVGEKGVTLSGGQKQRVSIARTLLQNPDILILDDVTSAVDSVTEAKILSGLQKNSAHQTTLIISHRLTTIPYVDRILIMEGGKLVSEGTHGALLKKNKFYQSIHEIQNVVEQEINEIKEK